MPIRSDKRLSDAELDRLARELFAEVRTEHPDKPPGNAAGDGGVDPTDWLPDGGCDAGGDGDGGD